MKIIKWAVLLTLFLISIALTSGLELSASTGGNDGSSSTNVVYGATVDDYANEHIGLNPEESTLSNAFSGSGSLPSSSISKSDTKGNYVSVSRSVSGKKGTTTWNYDWSTYTPTSPTAGSGVGATLTLTVNNAYSIYGRGYASNKEGDTADASMTVGSSSTASSSLINYCANPTAFTDEARVYQSATSATSLGPTTIKGSSNNAEKDYTTATISTTKGTISRPTTNVYSGKTSSWSYPTASLVDTTGTGKLDAYASNLGGDSSRFGLTVTNGKVTNPNFYAWAGTGFAETWASIPNAYGSTTEINSQGLDKALGYEEHWAWNSKKRAYDRIKTKVERGEGDFAAKKISNAQFSNVAVTTRSTKNDIIITATGFGDNTALILDPRRWEFVTDVGGSEIRDSVMTSLKNKGYAVTYYSDAAVSKDKVKQMDEYKVSAITTHSSPTLMYLSKSTDGINFDTMTASELKSEYTNSNGMALVVGCDSFTSTGTGTWADAISNANVRGGTTASWGIVYSRTYLNKYFASMSSGNTASYANNYAAGSSGQKLNLLGNTGFKL
ncbi:MAG: hypothetical protein M0Q43_07245 [Methanothrix sp.]|jgi:hypothetical protein|nr:hypothetical protein [Methanothrix sp.]